jgi:hypothetical protein
VTGPDFRELVGEDVPAEERARLKRVHDLLVAAGPPPDLTPALADPPEAGGTVSWLPRRRGGAALVLAAALLLTAFAAGFLIGDRGDSSASRGFDAERTVLLGKSGSALAVVRVGKADRHGNHQMLVTVEGLERQSGGDYYSLLMLRDGEPVAVCGTFNVASRGATTIRLTTAYDFEGYDGLMLAEYRAADHQDHPLLTASL